MKAPAFSKSFWVILIFICQQGFSQSISGIVNSYYQVTAINIPSNTATLNTVAGLSVGTKVLIIQMKGANINTANAATYGDISALNNAGNYEFNYICSISGNDVVLQYQLINSYTPANQVQLVSIPVYSAVTVAGPLTGSPWDPATGTGGVVAVEATASITLNSSIDVSGQGYVGAALQNYPVPPYDCSWAFNITDYSLSIPPSDQYHTGGMKGEGVTDYIVNQQYGRGKLANGGGGGNNNNTGGGGGGNYGAGGKGGNRTNESFFSCHGTNAGVGGLGLSPYGYSPAQNRIFLGGGGGGGHENNGVGMPGGNGGGIVILTAPVITGAGNSILANGLSPQNPACVNPAEAEGDGGGGGGAGGTIILNAATVSGSIIAQADGAAGTNASNNVGDCTGPGGGGGGGVIWVSGGSFPGAITGSVNGGANGVVSAGSGIVACRGSANGAVSGTSGNMQTAFVPPMGSSSVCTILPISDLKYFAGKLISDGAELSWGLFQNQDISGYVLEFSVDQVSYTAIKTFGNLGEQEMHYDDKRKLDGTTYYRLKLIFMDGSGAYSPVVPLTRADQSILQLLSLQPNPVMDQLNLAFYSRKMTNAYVTVYDTYGQRIFSMRQDIGLGYSNIRIPVTQLAAGAYMMIIEGKGIHVSKTFLKRQ